MNVKRVLLAAFAGAVVWFLLAGAILGGVLNAYLFGNMNEALAGETLMDKFGGHLILLQFVSLFSWSLLLALVIGWTRAFGWKAGARTGAVIGFLLVVGLEVTLQVFTSFWRSPAPMIVETILITLFAASSGATIGAILKRGSKNA